MAKVHYKWAIGERPPVVQQHSVAKHEILRAYLVAYIQTLISSPRQEEFRLTLVDGFAGGGIYRHASTREEVLGSPFVMLDAVKEAEFLVNKDRHKKVRLHLDYFFIEHNKGAAEVLRHQLQERGYGLKLEVSIFVFQSRFQDRAEEITAFIRKKGRAARSIFLLDQYGYSEVPAPLINKLLQSLPGGEVILTFAVDSFLNFAGDNHISKGLLERIGIQNVFRGRTIEEIKRSEKDWRLFIQGCLYQDLVNACGARFYTPFFIRSSQGHGDYWLLHLSQKPRARDVMTRIHWEKNNYFIHYGDAGLDMFNMLGYVPEKDQNFTGQLDMFCFDDSAKIASISKLMEQIPKLIYPDPEGISFGEFFARTCNTTPASAHIYREALGNLVQFKELEVISPDGTERRSAGRIHDSDQILPPRQRHFLF
ncbi:MAG: hypothetical protein CVU68_01200 [Deltaproteobacteria bacterium HGW-Deltaproteobacteria-3]|nr:MAG: hypothetical protein CVU68_01200 [Deltaproteobacteria bacterium HGW-Deltaproteobacteria-3]